MWVYILGESNQGETVKIGKTTRKLYERIADVNAEQHGSDRFVLLAAMCGDGTAETTLQRYFAEYRAERGARTEYFRPEEPLVEYILWLRNQYCVVTQDDADKSDVPVEHHSYWMPAASRRLARPPIDPSKLIQDEQLQGPLAGTAWSWMPDPLATFQDYFTPPDIVRRVHQAMGGIDLDAASHFLANQLFRKAGITIASYYSVSHSAFDHDWNGKVWLNPPYGDNERWFRRAKEMLDANKLRQLCWLSPTYVFTTGIAKAMMSLASTMVLLQPTPEFYNPGQARSTKTGRLLTGTNHPHMIVYWGHRKREFLAAFAEIGIPFRFAWDEIKWPIGRLTDSEPLC